jgi:hypothetical protein
VERGGREFFFRTRFLSLRLGRRCITTNHIKYEYIYATQNAAFYVLHAASMTFCACHRGHRRPWRTTHARNRRYWLRYTRDSNRCTSQGASKDWIQCCVLGHCGPPSAPASCSICCVVKLLPGGDGPCWSISSAILQQDGLHDVELLRSSLSSSVRPAIASAKNSARANTTVSTAAAAQAVRRGRAGSAHHLLQPCSLHALPASRSAAIDAKKPLNFPAVFACFGSRCGKVPSSSFFEAAHRNTKTTTPEL